MKPAVIPTNGSAPVRRGNCEKCGQPRYLIASPPPVFVRKPVRRWAPVSG